MAEPLEWEEGQQWEAVKAFAYRHRLLLGALMAVIGVGAAAGGIGYYYYHQRQQGASVEYHSGIGALERGQPKEARQAFTNLIQEYSGTVYAAFGRVFRSRLLQEAGKSEKALKVLQPLVQGETGPDYARHVAVEEAARIHWDRGNIEQALAVLKRVAEQAFLPSYFLLKGDLLAAAEQPQAARRAYELARGKPGSRALQPSLEARLASLPEGPESGKNRQ